MWKSLSKYKAIVITISLFVILDAGVLAVNYYVLLQISDDAHAVNIAARQTTLSQQITRQLYELRENVQQGTVAEKETTITALSRSYQLFDETIDSFMYGGQLIGRGQNNDSLLVDKNYAATQTDVLDGMYKIWSEYRRLLSPIIYYDFYESYREEKMSLAVERALVFFKENGGHFHLLLEQFADNVELIAQNKTVRLRRIQTLGVALALINFFIIIFYFIRNFVERDAVIDRAIKENERILLAVNEGLFLINRDFTVGSQCSASMESYFSKKNISGMDVFALLEGIVTDETLSAARQYFKRLFDNDKQEEPAFSLNPLRQLEVHRPNAIGGYTTGFVEFKVNRVYHEGKVKHLLVTVNDVTEMVRLKQALSAIPEYEFTSEIKANTIHG